MKRLTETLLLAACLAFTLPATATKSAQKPQAAAQEASAQYDRGVAYYEGRGVPQDFTHARQWFEKAAAQGHAGAQNKLGVMYYEGQGVRQDYEQARRWFEKAAAQGSAAAQIVLAGMHYEGQGVPQDYGQARHWFEKAAAQGNANAQFVCCMTRAGACGRTPLGHGTGSRKPLRKGMLKPNSSSA